MVIVCTSGSPIFGDGEPPVPDGRRLREIVSQNFPKGAVLIGATIGAGGLRRPSLAIVLDREFGYVTPENDYKHMIVRADPANWNWTPADAWEKHVKASGQVLRMHCPIGPQCSRWAKEDVRTAEELSNELKAFLQKICQRYNGKHGYAYMDVVNETIEKGNWHKDKAGSTQWECPWFKIGQDTDKNKTPLFIGMSFEVAKQFAPDTKFIFNHHEEPAAVNSWRLIKETIHYLRARNLRVDGIGWQAHVDSGWETPERLARLKDLITWAHANSLEFHVTEASVWLKKGRSETQLKGQADTYRAILRALLENRQGGVVAWNTWHVSDAVGWHTEWHPSLFDADCRAKPAYYGIHEELVRATRDGER